MTQNTLTPTTTASPSRIIAIIGGLGLLLMAVLAPIAEFGIFQTLIIAGDAQATARNIVKDEGMLRIGIALFLTVAILDVLVAWALHMLLRTVNHSLSLLAGWLRLAYSAVLAAALTGLLVALQLLTDPAAAQAFSVAQIQVQATPWLAAFRAGWDLGLAIFGLHLVMLGAVVTRSGFLPRWLGWLVIVAGLGYLIDSLGRIALVDYTVTLSAYTFIGEPLLIFWLIGRGLRGFGSRR